MGSMMNKAIEMVLKFESDTRNLHSASERNSKLEGFVFGVATALGLDGEELFKAFLVAKRSA